MSIVFLTCWSGSFYLINKYEDICICASSHKEEFFCHRYACSSGSYINDVLSQYYEAFNDPGKATVSPQPFYKSRCSASPVLDTQYRLLQLYAHIEKHCPLDDGQVEELLDVAGHSDAPEDVLQSWLLLVVLLSAGALKERDVKGHDQVSVVEKDIL